MNSMSSEFDTIGPVVGDGHPTSIGDGPPDGTQFSCETTSATIWN